MDDLWYRRQENSKKEFPFVYPAMPRRFRVLRVLSRGLLLLQWGSGAVMGLSLTAAGGWMLLRGEPPLGLAALTLLSLALFVGFTLLRCIPGLFWRCPCCGRRFPHYWPTYYSEELREGDCLQEMDFLRIVYIRPRVCSLIFPSVCPNCGEPFFCPPRQL